MAVQVAVNRFARKLAIAVRRYAAKHGVDAAHLAMIGIHDRKSGLIYLTVGVDLPIDQSAWVAGIRGEVRDEFSGFDPIITQYYLAVSQVDDLEMIDDKITGDDDDLEVIHRS